MPRLRKCTKLFFNHYLTFPVNDVVKKDTPRFPLMVSVNSNDSTITTRGTLFGIPEGVKIISINGISSKEIIQNMMKYVSGERTFFKLTCVIRVC